MDLGIKPGISHHWLLERLERLKPGWLAINWKMKLDLFRIIFMYGSETWTRKAQIPNCLNWCHIILLCRVQHLSWKNHLKVQQMYGNIWLSRRLIQSAFAGHFFCTKCERILDLIPWNPSRGLKLTFTDLLDPLVSVWKSCASHEQPEMLNDGSARSLD